jgi:hypothetical protein
MCIKYGKDIIMLTSKKVFKKYFMLTYRILSRGKKRGKKKTIGRRGHGVLANTSK